MENGWLYKKTNSKYFFVWQGCGSCRSGKNLAPSCSSPSKIEWTSARLSYTDLPRFGDVMFVSGHGSWSSLFWVTASFENIGKICIRAVPEPVVNITFTGEETHFLKEFMNILKGVVVVIIPFFSVEVIPLQTNREWNEIWEEHCK